MLILIFITNMTLNLKSSSYPASIYMFKVNNRNTGARCEICSKLTIKTPDTISVSIVNFEQVNAHWVRVIFRIL